MQVYKCGGGALQLDFWFDDFSTLTKFVSKFLKCKDMLVMRWIQHFKVLIFSYNLNKLAKQALAGWTALHTSQDIQTFNLAL